MIVMTLNDL